MSQKWIIKDSLDQVSGPFDTPEVIRRIHQGLVTEEDFLASYPEGKWIPVTKNQIFFDEMLASISKSTDKSTNKSTDKPTDRSNNKTTEKTTDKTNDKSSSSKNDSFSDSQNTQNDKN